MNNLYKPFTFENGAVLKNRFCLAPMTTYASNDDLTLSKEEEIYYNARAKQFGMVITAATAVSKHAQAFNNQISIMDDSYLTSMKRLANAIKIEGSKAVVQLHHGGRMNAAGLYPNQDIVSASAIKAERANAVTPRALELKEVYQVIEEFAQATKRAIEAGFDGVELHGANTYLLQQFFSAHSNRRTDEFGGSLEKRYHFIDLLVDRVIETKEKYASKDFIIGYRFSPEERENPGITLSDTYYLVDKLSDKDIDYLHVSLGKYNQSSIRNENQDVIAVKLLEVIRKRKPLIGVGGIDHPSKANDAVNIGYELVSLGFIALSDINVIDHFKKGLNPNRHISKRSLLPTKLYNRLKNWDVTNYGYTIE